MAPLDDDRLRAAWDNAETFKPNGSDETGKADDTADLLAGFTDPTKLDGIDPPDREWIIDGWLPIGSVTSLYGKGGVGKTLLAQQIQTAVGTGQSFLGLETTQCKVLSIFCEDDEDELHRRQVCINISMGVGMPDLAAIRWQGRFGKDNVMATFSGDGIIQTTNFYEMVRLAAKHFGVGLIIVDNAAQVYAGNENDRCQVTQFVNKLGAIALEVGAAVLLLGHPAKADGSEYSGSTGWDAAVRSRWIMERPKEDTDEQDASELADLRVLRKAKANYAGTGDEIPLRWEKGAFRPVGGARIKDTVDKIEERLQEKTEDTAFLSGLHTLLKTGFEPAYKVEARSCYAPKLLKKAAPECRAMSIPLLQRIMDRLIQSGEVVMGYSAGPPSRRKAIIVPKGHAFAQGTHSPSDTPSDTPADTCEDPTDTPSHCAESAFEHPTDTYGHGSQVIDIPSSQTGYEHPTDTYEQGSQVIDIPTSDRFMQTPLYTTYIDGAPLGGASPSEDTKAPPASNEARPQSLPSAEPATPDWLEQP